MVEKVEQPKRQIYTAPNQQRLSYAPSTQGINQAGNNAREAGRILQSLGTVGQMRKQYVEEEQRQIDILDKHVAQVGRTKYLPEILNQIAENNLEGASPEEVLKFVKGTEAYNNIFSGVSNTDTKAKLYEMLDAELWSNAETKRYAHQQLERQNIAVNSMASYLEMASDYGQKAVEEVLTDLEKDFTSMDGPFKFTKDEYETLVMGMTQALVEGSQYELASMVSKSYKPKTAQGIHLKTRLDGQIEAGLQRIEKERIKQEYTVTGDRLIMSDKTTVAMVEDHVQHGIAQSLFSDGADADRYRKYLLGKLEERASEVNLLPMLLSGQVTTLEELKYSAGALQELLGGTKSNADNMVRKAVEGFYLRTKHMLSEAYESEDEAMIEQAKELYARAIRFQPMEVKSKLIRLASAHIPPDVSEGFLNRSPEKLREFLSPELNEILFPIDGQPALFDQWAEAYNGNKRVFIAKMGLTEEQTEQLQMFVTLEEAWKSREMAFRAAFDARYRDELGVHPSHKNPALIEKALEDFYDEGFPHVYSSYFRRVLQRYNFLPVDKAAEAAMKELAPLIGELDMGYFELGRPVFGLGSQKLQDDMLPVLTERLGEVADPTTGSKKLTIDDSPKKVLESFIRRKLKAQSDGGGAKFSVSDVKVFYNGNGHIELRDPYYNLIWGGLTTIDEVAEHGVARRKDRLERTDRILSAPGPL